MDMSKRHDRCRCVKKLVKANRYDNPSDVVNYWCKDHNVMCGKNFWELGWYGGTDSRKLYINPLAKIEVSEEKKTKILEMHKTMTIKDIAEHFRHSANFISRIIKINN